MPKGYKKKRNRKIIGWVTDDAFIEKPAMLLNIAKKNRGGRCFGNTMWISPHNRIKVMIIIKEIK